MRRGGVRRVMGLGWCSPGSEAVGVVVLSFVLWIFRVLFAVVVFSSFYSRSLRLFMLDIESRVLHLRTHVALPYNPRLTRSLFYYIDGVEGTDSNFKPSPRTLALPRSLRLLPLQFLPSQKHPLCH